MKEHGLTMPQRIAQAVRVFQEQQTGHAPKTVNVALSDNNMLIITLHDVLSPAEKALASTAEGAVQVQEFHRQLFKSRVDVLGREIKRITGLEVVEAAAEVETTTSAVVHTFSSGTSVQVFRLSGDIPVDTWHERPPLSEPDETEA
jgi:uncharacterized protein YbcI